ncbi:hypothetical protein DM02DRAFT_531823 [Periconia macrospinosa]|uniref:Uncharacterized protein n=1 Tax=Periconia macrospinosa TaxID=97972 RepID=A0A2V1DJ15_9PLEO|nr:hypothetical protein DM02DRAFT_531823 [Periconia macrospinosa]
MAYDGKGSVHRLSKALAWMGWWLTPLIISVCFVLALLVAVAHYFYCFKLHERPVDQSVPQSWNSTISMIFARIFSLLLAASVSPAFTQLLWWYLRRRHISISKIDALFSLSTAPSKLCRLDILRHVPVLWIFGLLFPLIPVTTIFPSGALVIQQLPYTLFRQGNVPTLDVDSHGNGSAVAFFENAMFTPGYAGDYRWPADRYKGLARKTLLQGAVLTRPSPCGLHCSYNLTFAGPGLRCNETTTMPNLANLPRGSLSFGGDLNSNPFKDASLDLKRYNYLGAPFKFNETINGEFGQESFVSFVGYKPPHDDAFRFISCVTMDATYNSQVMYTNGTQSITLQTTSRKSLNASSLGVSSMFYDLMFSQPRTDPMEYPTKQKKYTKEQVLDLMHGSQLRAMSDAMLNSFWGYIKNYGLEDQNITDTMIQEIPLAIPVRNSSEYRYVDLRLDLSPSKMEKLMENITLSIFNDATHRANTTVKMISYENAYVFKDPGRLIIPYTVALVICLVFNSLGLFALKQNGVAADSGTFLQVLCATTNGNSVLNKLAKEACLGGSNNHSQELLDMEVRFGEVKENTAVAAFGTVEETNKLRKGKDYGQSKPLFSNNRAGTARNY